MGLLLAVLIFTTCLATPTRAQPPAVTYARNIAPILDRSCASCHRPNGGAPFSLLTYDDARRRVRQIRTVTERRSMPPWKPEPGYGEFEGMRRLSDDEIELIQRWVDAGAPEGDPGDRPVWPTWPDGWHLGPPDLVVRMPTAYTVAAEGKDIYRNFTIPRPVAEARYVRAVEIRFANPGVVHHARILVDRTSTSRRLDEEDAEAGYDGMLIDRAEFPEGHFLGWAPGKMPNVAPSGLAWRLDPGTDLVLQLHLVPTGKTETVRAEVGLYVAEFPPNRTPALLLLSSKTIDIPAGERAYVVEDRYTLPVDLQVLAIYPHAHYLGRRIESFAELPGGTTRWLLLIKDWDFRWQDEYRYVEPVALPKGSTVVMRYTFDNSGANPRNPHVPSQRVRFGPQATDEMAELMLQVLPLNSFDRARLVEDVSRKALREDIAGFRAQLEQNPRDQISHMSLGVRYVEIGDIERAIAHFEEALRIDPTTAAAHYDLGTVLSRSGRLQEAVEHFRRAIELKPDFAEAHNNLGSVLQSMGNLADAASLYRLALQFEPRHVGAHYNLGNLLQAEGQLDEAMAHYRLALETAPNDSETRNSLARGLAFQRNRAEAVAQYRMALKVSPNLIASMIDLAWLLATSPEEQVRNSTEAVRLAERAADLTNHGHAGILDTLAAAYAADGQFGKAVEMARTALTLARQAKAIDFAENIQLRLQLYMEHRPFLMQP